MSRNFFDEALKELNVEIQKLDCKFILKKSKKYNTENVIEDTYIDLKLHSGNIMLSYDIGRHSSLWSSSKNAELIDLDNQVALLYEKINLLCKNKSDSMIFNPKGSGSIQIPTIKALIIKNDILQNDYPSESSLSKNEDKKMNHDNVQAMHEEITRLRKRSRVLEDTPYWNLVGLDNTEVLKEFLEIIKEELKIDLTDKIESFENKAKVGLEKSFKQYSNMYENLEKLFTMKEGIYDIGDIDSLTEKVNNVIYLKDYQHPVFFKVEKQDNVFILYLNHKNNTDDYSDLGDKEKLEWEKIVLLGENQIQIDKIYFNELGHLKYLVEPTLSEESLFIKTKKLKL